MPTSKNQKSEARKSREADLTSDIENMLSSNYVEREESEISNSVRKSETPSCNALTNHDLNFHSNTRDNVISGYARNGHNSRLTLVARSLDSQGN